jgi:hypothetical protein
VKRILFAVALACSLSASGAATPVHAATAPAATPIKGDVIAIGDLFHIEGWNVRITRIGWVPAATFGAMLQRATGNLPPEGDLGYLVITAQTKNVGNVPGANTPPNPMFQLFYKDGTQSAEGAAQKFSATADTLFPAANYQPGAGPTLRYVLVGVAKPDAANPVTKLLVKAGSPEAGFPPAFRMLVPTVHVPN